jgi:hypothetical protein
MSFLTIDLGEEPPIVEAAEASLGLFARCLTPRVVKLSVFSRVYAVT